MNAWFNCQLVTIPVTYIFSIHVVAHGPARAWTGPRVLHMPVSDVNLFDTSARESPL